MLGILHVLGHGLIKPHFQGKLLNSQVYYLTFQGPNIYFQGPNMLGKVSPTLYAMIFNELQKCS